MPEMTQHKQTAFRSVSQKLTWMDAAKLLHVQLPSIDKMTSIILSLLSENSLSMRTPVNSTSLLIPSHFMSKFYKQQQNVNKRIS